MNDKIKRFTFYNIFFLCAFLGLFMVLNFKSYALNHEVIEYNIPPNDNGYSYHEVVSFAVSEEYRYCIYYTNGHYTIYSNNATNFTYYYDETTYVNGEIFRTNSWSDTTRFSSVSTNVFSSVAYPYIHGTISSSSIPVINEYNDLINYLENGQLPVLPFDDTLELDSLKVKSWQLGTSQGVFKSSFEVTWSDERITLVQVIIKGVSRSDSFESYSSPFKQKFSAGQYVLKKGDIVHITATPYKADGSYGVSLYQSFEYDDNIPGSNIYRKFTNKPYSDNTLTIPYTGVSGQPQSVTLPVDGVTTQNVYKVNYNPQTYEYGDINLYEIYYSPVVVYPSDATEEEIDETQDVINNTYTTNNYYETTKNINIDFDVSFGDISGSDIQHGFDDFGNFGNGFGNLLGKLSSWVLALFPFLNPIVASAIVIFGGLIIGLAIIAFVLKIASVIADLIPF